jgi:SAM-dependent methyltransferase
MRDVILQNMERCRLRVAPVLESHFPPLFRSLRPLWRRGKGLVQQVHGTTSDALVRLEQDLNPSLPLPQEVSCEDLVAFLNAVRVSHAPEAEKAAYCSNDFKRFVYTFGMTRGLTGRCLELGSNPYFTTSLLKQFSTLDVTPENYFFNDLDEFISQDVNCINWDTSEQETISVMSYHFNIETDRFPFKDEEFDVVLFCEIIEHLIVEPMWALREIKRVLKRGGTLILTTPNVARLENIARLLRGHNIYDPYSGYGPYGRHNREYTIHEIQALLSYLGYEVSEWFTADVHPTCIADLIDLDRLASDIAARSRDLGQYLFVRAVNAREGNRKRPAFLFRSYPPDELE